jgi:hypothetical protein
MKKIIVASYGGSGSTFITKKVKELVPDAHVYHTHATPSNSKLLGIPTLNTHTGHAEGPLSNWRSIGGDDKVIIICRNPAEAYMSRACYKHFSHIWFGHSYYKVVMGEGAQKNYQEGQEHFNKIWPSYITSNKDILNLRLYLEEWWDFCLQNKPNVIFLKYEDLNDNINTLLEFLSINTTDTQHGFTPIKREIPNKIEGLFKETTDFYNNLPSCKIFFDENSVFLPPILSNEHVNSTFTIVGGDSGFGDFFARYEIVYDFVKNATNLNFYHTNYINYHSSEIDMFSYLDFDKNEVDSKEKAKGLEDLEIDFTDFLSGFLSRKDFLKNDINYIIRANCYKNDNKLNFYCSFIKNLFAINLVPKIKLAPLDDRFFTSNSSLKVVFHLRRSDIIYNEISEVVPQEKLEGFHARELLDINTAINFLKKTPEFKSINCKCIEVVITSDGVDGARERFKNDSKVQNSLDRIEEALHPNEKHLEEFYFHKSIIGKGVCSTKQTIAAMLEADIIITKSSCFPNLYSRLGKARLITAK